MQQLIITLIALLGMIVPVANSRIAKFFKRFVPQMPAAGRMPADTRKALEDSTVLDQQLAGIAQAQTDCMQTSVQPDQSGPDPQQRRIRKAQRATGWRNAPSDLLQAFAFRRGFFLVLSPLNAGSPRTAQS